MATPKRMTSNRTHIWALACVVVVALGTLPRATAKTWRVERDGSGDFTVIQHAVDAASAGDTVLIGKGRYPERSYRQIGAITETTCVHVTVDDLTLRGVDRDSVIIGQEFPTWDAGQLHPNGIVIHENRSLTIENLTIEHLAEGIQTLTPEVYVKNSVIRGNRIGTAFDFGNLVRIEDSYFPDAMLAVLASNSGEVEILRCEFEGGPTTAVVFSGDTNGIVRETQIRAGAGVKYQLGADGGIYDSVIVPDPVDGGSIGLTESADVELKNSYIGAGLLGIAINSPAILRGSGNVVRGGSDATILFFVSRATADFHGNFIEVGPAGRHSIWALEQNIQPNQIDLSGNYWGGITDADSLHANYIWDSRDEAGNMATVIVEPLLAEDPTSVPLPPSSMSKLKAGFAPRRE